MIMNNNYEKANDNDNEHNNDNGNENQTFRNLNFENFHIGNLKLLIMRLGCLNFGNFKF